jgi:hypothetical protein
LFEVIGSEIVKALQENIPDISRENISTRKPDIKKPAQLPAISVSSSEFTFEDAGVGGGGSDVKDQAEEHLSGDGKTTSFTLSGRPIRPLLRVEAPEGEVKLEKSDYTVDYGKRVITFSSPPPKGRNNILVRYYSAKAAGDTKFVRMNITYNVDVWAKDEPQRDRIAVDAIKAILLAEEGLATKGIRVKPSQGLNFEPESKITDGVFAKRLVYNAEAHLEVKVPVPTIERIEIEHKPPK